MSNVFRKLIQKEFGVQNYYNYLFQYQEIIYGEQAEEVSKPKKQEVYNHMYNIVLRKDKQTLAKMKERMENTMLMAAGISKYFRVVILVYLISLLILLAAPISNTLLLSGIIGVSVCFFVKLREYISNKYCFIDVYLFGIYNEILSKVMSYQDRI